MWPVLDFPFRSNTRKRGCLKFGSVDRASNHTALHETQPLIELQVQLYRMPGLSSPRERKRGGAYRLGRPGVTHHAAG